MSYNALIANKLQTNKTLAVLLDKGLQGSGRAALEQAEKITSGFTRITWYSSYFFDNYQDVCSNLSHEDIRFLKSIFQLVVRPDVVMDIVEVMVKDMIGNQSEERINNIGLILLKKGAQFSSARYTSKAFTFAISSSICSGFGMRVAMNSVTTSLSKGGVGLISAYSFVKIAADAANRLKARKPMVYTALYKAKLEMLYFIVEPTFSKVDSTNFTFKSDEEIANDIIRIIQ